jgi:hypothetical protein
MAIEAICKTLHGMKLARIAACVATLSHRNLRAGNDSTEDRSTSDGHELALRAASARTVAEFTVSESGGGLQY